MRKPIFLHKNYTLNEGGYQLKLPLNLETIIPEDDSVRLLSQFVEGMDLTDLYSTYERINSVSPKTLLKIVLYSYITLRSIPFSVLISIYDSFGICCMIVIVLF